MRHWLDVRVYNEQIYVGATKTVYMKCLYLWDVSFWITSALCPPEGSLTTRSYWKSASPLRCSGLNHRVSSLSEACMFSPGLGLLRLPPPVQSEVRPTVEPWSPQGVNVSVCGCLTLPALRYEGIIKKKRMDGWITSSNIQHSLVLLWKSPPRLETVQSII